MIKFHKLIASVLGIGYIGKGGGTIAAIVYCIIWFFFEVGEANPGWQIFTTLLIVIIGTWSANEVDPVWGTDSNKVVVDEIAGMAITLLYVPKDIWYVLVGLVAFRFFDIAKPLGVRRAETLPKGWGVMAGDVLAGFYALAVMQLWIMMVRNFS